MHDGDRHVREVECRVELLDRRIVPGGDVTQEDVRKRGSVQNHLIVGNPRNVHHRHVAADDRRKHGKAELVEIGRLQRLVGRAERHRFGLDLRNAAAGTDRLVVQMVAVHRGVRRRPFRVDRVGKSRAGA